MAKNLEPKCKQCRREGLKLMLKGTRCESSKCAMVKRNYPPGMHGTKGRARLTDYGVQFREKQKAKRIYNILETQFVNYYKKAFVNRKNTSEALMHLLETRLDSLVYRLGFTASRAQARNLVNHRHFLVNGNIVNIPSYRVHVGDVIELKVKSKTAKIFANLDKKLENQETPDWLSLDPINFKGKLLSLPPLEQLALPFNVKSIIEFYSR